jgi:selenocysteine lyase/cysteine desulfurase
VTTDGEFHSVRRQLRRLSESGVDVTFVPASPVATLSARLAAAVRPETAALLASTVLFESSTLVPGIAEAVEAAQRAGAVVLLDAYHAFNVVPFRVEDLGPEPLFLVAGGYKYAQWGEGVCFLRVPSGCDLRPVYTGWFSEMGELERGSSPGAVSYGSSGADRFAGSTYDPASHYRARAVIRFFREQGLTVERLKSIYDAQTERILTRLEREELVTPLASRDRGGFVAVRVARAAEVVARLRQRGVAVDHRGDIVRIGPAPYITEDELERGLDRIVEALAALRGGSTS